MEEKLKFDFESEKGAELCQDILQLIARLFTTCQLSAHDRSYREKFTNAYKLLYSRHGGQEQLCYLLEIMDSAQENFPHLWVNGEKYVFSDDVLAAGDSLYRNLLSIRDFVAKIEEFS